MFHSALIRKSCCWAMAPLGVCLFTFSPEVNAQNTIQLHAQSGSELRSVAPSAGPSMHGPASIDLSRLPADVLNCDVCRARLGLPPISTTKGPSPQDHSRISATQKLHSNTRSNAEAISPTSGAPNAKSSGTLPTPPISIPGPMLGSPGLIPANVAEQMAQQGLVVEEFKPPEPEAGAINLDSLPREARQQFLKQLDLPWGARVMSANVKGVESLETQPPATEATTSPVDGTPEVQREPGPLAALPTPLNSEIPNPAIAELPPPKSIVPQPPTAEVPAAPPLRPLGESSKLDSFKRSDTNLKNDSLDSGAIEKSQQAALDQQRSEFANRQRQLEAANAETLKLLETRTIELEQIKAELAALKKMIESQANEKTLPQPEIKGQDKSEPKPDKKKGKPPRSSRPFVNGDESN